MSLEGFICLLAAALLLTPRAGFSGTYYVDGACPSSGTGSSLTCGANGPFKTIMEAVKKAAQTDGVNPPSAPVTIDVRGAHDAFNGLYDEYVGLWGVGNTAAPGGGAYYALNCTQANPCVIQGCPASACGSDETASISGLANRTDWTETTTGSGIWYRTMESRTEPVSEFGLADAYDPGHLAQGATADSTRTQLQYSQTTTSPAEGRWYYDSSTHRAYVNPVGTGNPNTDASARIWVPDRRGMVEATNGVACGDATCPTNSNLTLRRLNIEGARYINLETVGSTSHQANLVLDTIGVRYTVRFGWAGTQFDNLTASNITVENMARGASTANFQGSFGIRLFHINGGTVTNTTAQHLGSAGNATGGICAAGGTMGVWLDTPWNSYASNPHCMMGTGLDLKQSNHVLVDRFTCTDASTVCLQIDETRDSEIRSCTIRRAGVAIRHTDYTPDVSGGADTLKNNLIHDCRIDDAGWNDAGAVDLKTTNDTLGVGEFTVKFYNNFISHASLAGIFIAQINGNGGATSQRVSLWNNSIWADRVILGYPAQDDPSHNNSANTPAAGIVVDTGQVSAAYPVTTLTDFNIRNNIIKNMNGGGLVVPGAGLTTSAITVDYNLYHNNSAPSVANWKGTTYTAVGAAPLLCTGAGFECHGVSGDPIFVNTASTPPDLHIQSTSAAKDVGVDLSASFTTDIDNNSRPYGPAWDIGASEYSVSSPPNLVQAVVWPTPTP